MKKYIFVFMISLFITSFFSYSFAVADTNLPSLRIIEMKYEPFPAEAGKYMKLFLKVENQGVIDAENVVCKLNPEYPFSLDPNEDPVREIGKLGYREDFLLEYKVRIDSNAVRGENELKLICDTDGLEDNTYVTKKITVDVESKNPEFAVSRIKSFPEDIKSGMEEVKMDVEIQNVGEGDADLVSTKLILPEGFEPSDSYSDSYSLGNFGKDSSKSAVFYMDVDKETEPGIHKAKLVVRYKYDNNQWEEYVSQEIDLEINVKKSPILNVEEVRAGTGTSSDSFTGYIVRGETVVNPSSLSQGDSGEIRIMVKNDGEEEANSVSVKVFRESTQPFEFEEVYDFIGNLKENQTGEVVFDFTVDEDAVLKKYFLDLEIRYLDDGEVYTETETIQLDVVRERVNNSVITVIIISILIIVGLYIWKKGILFKRINQKKERVIEE